MDAFTASCKSNKTVALFWYSINMRCLSPFYKDSMAFPCGKCVPCLKRRVSGWSFRLVKEGFRAESSFFVTLTYNTDYVPITKNGFMSLQKRDVQLFFKRLRKSAVSKRKIRYYVCGEYGGQTKRPHYHAIIFDADILEVEKAWICGSIHCGQVSEASIGYTLKYMMKPKRIPMHKNDDRIPEFQLCSKGIGSNYLTPAMRNWHEDDLFERFYCALPGGKKIAMPRYYKNKLYTDSDRQAIGNYLSTKCEQIELTGKEEIVRFEAQSRRGASRLNESL